MSATIDQQFIEYIVKSLVGKPDAVKIERRIDEKGVLLELTVDPEDLGRVIGKRGATAQSLRTLLRALGTKNDARYNLKIIDNGFPPPRSRDDSAAAASEPSATSKSDDVDQPKSDEPEISDEVEETPAQEPEPEVEEPHHSDMVSRTRAELADLDDLDV